MVKRGLSRPFGALFSTGLLLLAFRAEGAPPNAYLTNVELMQLAAKGAVLEALRGFEPPGEGPLLLRGGEPTDADWLVEMELVDALRARGFAVRVGELQKARVVSKPKEHEKNADRAKADLSFPVDTPPELIEGPGVPYPEQACAEGLSGEVTVRLIVNEQGSVANVIVDESTGEPFESAVLAAVNAYRFRPGQLGGQAAPSAAAYTFRFPALPEGCAEARVKAEAPGEGGGAEKAEEAAPDTAAPAPAAGPPGESVLTFRVSEMELRYPDVSRKYGVGPKRVDRFARMRLDLRLMNGSDLLWSGSAEHYVSDRVPFGALRYLENDQYAFAKPEIAEGSALRFVEPLVVAGVIGGLVLLFYANQTGN